jgi:glycosyltransferase involved in cell wall biosynthesis
MTESKIAYAAKSILHPKVTAVIPTRFRPDLVRRAVESVLKQTYEAIEAIVVIDGPDPATEAALARISDLRLRVIPLGENQGGSEARNIGARAAQGEWIAFLDDDDEWLPEKISTQLEWAEANAHPYQFVCSSVIARSPVLDRVWPRRLPGREPMSEYLFCRKGFTYGDSFLQTSTVFVSRKLLQEVPFLKGLKRHQDWDWLLRVSRHPEARISVVPKPMTIFRLEDPRGSVSRTADWEFSLNWALANQSTITPKALSYFIATECVPRAVKSGSSLGVYARLFREFFFRGSPRIGSLVLFLVFWLAPERRRRAVRDTLSRWKRKLTLRADRAVAIVSDSPRDAF